jgi:signal transduction histidine kinase/ligand-binding sensor domain-containing protein
VGIKNGVKKVLGLFFFLFLIQLDILGNSNIRNDSVSFRQINYESGLPGNNLRDQLQDHSGIMWISVEASGVSRYDGRKFTTFKNIPGDSTTISSNFVNKIVEGQNHNLWFATDNGLSRFDRDNLTFVQYHSNTNDIKSIPSDICGTVFIDSKQRLWVGTGNGLALLRDDQKTFDTYLTVENLDDIENGIVINIIIEQPEDVFYLGTNLGLIKFTEEEGIVNIWNEGSYDNELLINNRTQAFAIDSEQRMWIGTHRGLDRFDLESQQFDHWYFSAEDAPFFRAEGINDLIIINDSMLWVSTYTKGIIVINTKNDDYHFIDAQPGRIGALQSSHIKYVYEDQDEVIWVGSKFGGLFQMKQWINLFENWPERLKLLKELSDLYIYSFYEDENDICWVGTKLEGLFKCDIKNNTITNFKNEPHNSHSLPSNRVQAIFRDNDGILWVGTDQGLQFMDEELGTFTRISANAINKIKQIDSGTIWVGTVNGLLILNKNSLKLENYQNKNYPSLFQNNMLDIYDILQAKGGRLWISTRNNGLFVFDEEADQLIHYTENLPNNHTINSDMVRCLFQDSQQNIWIGTKVGGLNKYIAEADSFIYYSVADGLPSPLVMSIREDDNSNLWIGTHNGLSRFTPATGHIVNFNSDLGLKSNIVEPGAVCHFSDGEMLFGGNDGFNVFYPGDIQRVSIEPKVMITNMSVYGQTVLQDILESQIIELTHDENYLSFDFIQLDYQNPYRHNYAYMLEGVDVEWNSSGNRNFVAYNDLDPGKYTFKVRAANEFGVWSTNNPEIQLVILSPFYQKNWFRFLAAFLVIVFVVLLIKYQSQKIKQRQNKLRRLVDERTKEFRDAVEALSEKNRIIGGQKQEIERHHAELERKVRERTCDLEIAMKKAEESDKLKSSFLANMSHEIRTPLNAICGFSSLLEDDDLDRETRKKYVDLVTTNSGMLLKLIDDILDLSKIEAEQLTVHFESFSLTGLMDELYDIFNSQVQELLGQNVVLINLVRENNSTNIELYSDQYRVRQVLSNLISNAVKFCRQGKIEYGYSVDNKYVLFYVKDTGIGIPHENQPKVFNRFIKIEDKKVMYRGTGLGLSISQSIVEMLGGKIWVESEPGIGSVFQFTIPLKQNVKSKH